MTGMPCFRVFGQEASQEVSTLTTLFVRIVVSEEMTHISCWLENI